MSVLIKPSTPEDIPKLVPLINISFNNFNGQGQGWTDAAKYVIGPRLNPEDPYELITDASNETSTILKYEEDQGKILGCVKLEIKTEDRTYKKIENGNLAFNNNCDINNRVCNLKLLAVYPGLQGKGIGSLLLDASEKWARSKFCSVIEIDVGSEMIPLIEYYERRGYIRTGEIKPYPIRPGCSVPTVDIHMVFLEKNLS